MFLGHVVFSAAVLEGNTWRWCHIGILRHPENNVELARLRPGSHRP